MPLAPFQPLGGIPTTRAAAFRGLVPPAVFGTPDWTLRSDGGILKLLVSKLGWREEAVGLDQPGRVVGLAEREQRLTQLLDGLEGSHPEQVFLEGADEPLGTATAFRGAHEGGRTLDPEKGDLVLELVRHVLRSVIVAHRRSAGDRLG